MHFSAFETDSERKIILRGTLDNSNTQEDDNILLDVKIGVGANKKTVFQTNFGCCRFQGKF